MINRGCAVCKYYVGHCKCPGGFTEPNREKSHYLTDSELAQRDRDQRKLGFEGARELSPMGMHRHKDFEQFERERDV